MIDLGPLGILQVQGSFYLPFFLAALIVCALNRPYWFIGLVTLIGWAGTRLLDMGGYFGDQMIAMATSEQMAVTSIAVSLIALDFFLAISLLYFQRDLKLSVLIAALYACMLPFYGLAAIGLMTGGAAIFWVNVIGLFKLGLILTSGGLALVHRRRVSAGRSSFSSPVMDFVAPWVVAQADLERDSESPRLS